MRLSLIINQIKAHADYFEGRVAGAAGLTAVDAAKHLAEIANMPPRSAYVLPLADDPDGPMSNNDVRQTLVETFAVVCCLDNTVDERGQHAVDDAVHDVRAQLWAALMGWRPEPIYGLIGYAGGNLLYRDRSRLWFQFEFSADLEITPEDGWQATELAALPDFTTLHIDLDGIDPEADRNIQYPGPDGRIEHQASITLPD
jgi:hypothetical protein